MYVYGLILCAVSSKLPLTQLDATGTDGVRRNISGPGRVGNATVRRAATTVFVHDRSRAGDEGLW